MTTPEKDSNFKFVDAHVHFYDMGHPTLYYGHWQPDADHPVLGSQTRKLGQRNYVAEDFLQEARPHGTVKAIHVQAAIGSPDPVEETAWLQAASESASCPNAIVGYVDLRGSDVQKQIERHMEFDNFKGIRDFSHGNYLENRNFRRGFSLLHQYNLVSSIAAEWQDMNKVVSLAKDNPYTTIVLDHAGLPQERTTDYFLNWKSGMSIAAEMENIICKISGLGMADNSWTKESIRPYVETCIELFGHKRSIFASNWPIDSLWSSYGDLITAYRKICSAYSESESMHMFSTNSEAIYQI